jgi:hypothetical protein
MLRLCEAGNGAIVDLLGTQRGDNGYANFSARSMFLSNNQRAEKPPR